jgi:hypothetical protein
MGDDRPEPQRTGRTTGSSVLTPPTGISLVPDDAGSLLVPPQSAEPVPAVPGPAVAWIPPDTTADAAALARSCRCGHGTPAHEHWRPGSDCGVCGASGCPTFRRHGGRVRQLLRRFRLVR